MHILQRKVMKLVMYVQLLNTGQGPEMRLKLAHYEIESAEPMPLSIGWRAARRQYGKLNQLVRKSGRHGEAAGIFELEVRVRLLWRNIHGKLRRSYWLDRSDETRPHFGRRLINFDERTDALKALDIKPWHSWVRDFVEEERELHREGRI